MSLVQRRPASPRRIAANQSNARKSTGPRTPPGKRRAAWNSLKHGRYAAGLSAFRFVMARLGEDPVEFDCLRESLVNSWKPFGLLQTMLVDDLARLSWLKLRAERLSREGLAERFREAEDEWERDQKERAAPKPPLSQFNIEFFGYHNADNCPEKFQNCEKLLGKLTEHVEKRDWSEGIQTVLKSLYGEAPDKMGARIILLISRFLDPKGPGADAEETYEELRTWLAQDKEQIRRSKESYERQQRCRGVRHWQEAHAGLGKVSLDEGDDCVGLDRRLAAKIRLLLLLKKAGGYRRVSRASKRKIQHTKSLQPLDAKRVDNENPSPNENSKIEGTNPLRPAESAA